jgi:predicted phage terminase large subunit-like protein
LPSNLKIIQGVDLAITQKTTSDYTAIATLGIDSNNNIYVIDVERQRLGYREILQFIQQKAIKYNPSSIGIESVAFQSIIADELTNITNLPIFKHTPKNDKLIRFTPLWSKFEAKKVYLNKDLPNYFEGELMEFPNSQHDDMIDALSYAYVQGNNPIEKLFTI